MKKLLFLSLATLMSLGGFAQMQTELDIAMRYLEQQAKTWELQKSDIADMAVSDHYVSQHNNVAHVYLIQRHQGVEIYNALANFNIHHGKVFHSGNRLQSDIASRVNGVNPVLSPEQAVEKALIHLGFTITEPLSVIQRISNREVIFAPGVYSRENIAVKLRYQVTKEGPIRLAWDIAIDAVNGLDYWNLRMDAMNGDVLDQNSWTIRCTFDHSDSDACDHRQAITHQSATPIKEARTIASNQKMNASSTEGTYHVFPVQVESPAHGSRQFEESPADPVASPFGWHDTDGIPGPESTKTIGNNVHAYEARTGNNNSLGNEPDGGNELYFDEPLDLNLEPETYVDASTVNLFYMINKLHDVSYQFGFTEVAGNFQNNTYQKGGTGTDRVNARAQFGAAEGQNLNNADFSTPPDGGNGTMRMFVWDRSASGLLKYLFVDSPSEVAGEYATSLAAFGPTIDASNPVSGEVVIVESSGSFPSQGCTAPNNDLTGKIALIDRGNCEFGRKVVNAQNAGAIAVIICNYEDALLGGQMGAGAVGNQATIPSVFIGSGDCQKIRLFANNGLTVTLSAPQDPDDPEFFDGTLDNGIVAHEFAHGVSNRLTGGPLSAGCLSGSEQMGEGWSDFFSLIFGAKEGNFDAQRRGIGTFVRREGNDGRGIRSFPYSTDFAVNPMTYHDILSQSVPHGVGSVWCTMLWDLYWAMADKYGYDPDFTNLEAGNNRAIQLVMDGMKLQPCAPGFVDGRDAILAADVVLYGGENECLIWEVFARRGLGVNADQGTSESNTDGTEDFTMPDCRPELKFRKTVSPIVNAGGEIDITLTVINDLPETISGVVVSDKVPEFVSVVAGSGGFNMTEVGDEVRFTVGAMAPNQKVEITYKQLTPNNRGSKLIYYDPCEVDDPNVWFATVTGGAEPNGFWSVNDLQAYNGANSWGVINPDTTLRSELIMFEPFLMDAIQPVLRFGNFYRTEYKADGGIVEISTDFGATHTIMTNNDIFRGDYGYSRMQFATFAIPNLDAWSGDSKGWQESYVDLSAFKDEFINVRFQFGSDGNTSDLGWWIDDFTLMDMVNYESEACVTYDQGEDLCATPPGRGTVVEHSTATTSVEDIVLDGIKVFPNPAKNQVNIQLEQLEAEAYQINLYSLDGRQVWHQNTNQINNQLISIPVSNLVSGMYILRIQTERGVYVDKIRIQP